MPKELGSSSQISCLPPVRWLGTCTGEFPEVRSPRDASGLSIDGMSDAADNDSQHDESHRGEALGQGIALVVDQEVTSYLMMGALSPGIKRHAVTLFEGRLLEPDCRCSGKKKHSRLM